LIEEFIAFVQAATWSDSRRYLEEHPGLLSREALGALRTWVASMDDEEEAWTYRYHYGLLESCVLMGIEFTFDNFNPSTSPDEGIRAPAEFVEDLRRLSTLDEMANHDPSVHYDRITLMEQILRRLHDDEERSFRGALLINLGQAYAQLPTADPGANLGKAFQFLNEAARFFTPKTAPAEYPESQNKLGHRYMELASGDPTANLEKAIACFSESLRFLSPDYASLDYAITQNDLGGAWARLASGDRVANLRRAIACFEESLRIFTPDTASAEHTIVQKNLSLATTNLNRALRESEPSGH
jgi:tetratricopeptide (TPR) repeat protein